AAAFIIPFLVVVLTAFMSQRESGTGALWPRPWVWSNFGTVFSTMPFGRDLLNTVIYAGVSAIGVMVSSTLAAFALARLRWRAREWVFVVVLATMMIPAQVTSLPLYVLYSQVGLVGTLWPLILPNLLCDAYSIFLLRQFFLTVPREVTEAAAVDGASTWRVLTNVMVPMTKPGIAAIGLFSFLYAWNDFYNPLLYTGNSNNGQTLAVGLTQLARSVHQQSYQLQMAASLMFVIPVIVIFFLAQRVFIEGINLGGIKE
ncbi:MAG: carbohydrate ABC transporter permease, partial [Actinomycetia bacterium]|nr:carbohydrate ABC transporter permease [Actinomycetes bacterium]